MSDSGILPNISVPNDSLQDILGHSLSPPINLNYLNGLLKERECIGAALNADLTRRLLDQEIERIQKDGRLGKPEESKMTDVTKDKSIKLSVKVIVPVTEHPKFNFVGKLLGPKGNSLKRLQEETLTKMAILGRGSMRDKQKEEDLRLSGDARFVHLFEDLHVEVTSLAPPAEAHARIAYALTEIRRYLVPDYNDEIRQEQMREIKILSKSTNDSPSTSCGEANNNKPESVGEDSPIENCSLANNRLSPPSMQIVVPQEKSNAVINAIKKRSGILASTGPAGSRRSVLSLLTKARALQQQQKEHDIIKVFPDINTGYNVFDTLTEIPTAEYTLEKLNGNSGAMAKIPTTRIRYRFDPYSKFASPST